jgi:hypothetical protein
VRAAPRIEEHRASLTPPLDGPSALVHEPMVVAALFRLADYSDFGA